MSPALQLLTLYWSLHFGLAGDVLQHPSFVPVLPMHNVSMSCEHDESSKTRKSWYRQEKGKGLVLIGYTDYGEKALMESGFSDDRIQIQPNGSQRCNLTIYEASAEDNAVYYCVSSEHSQTIVRRKCKKLSRPL